MTDGNQFTFLFDHVVAEVGLVTAAVYGVIWRYCQRRDKECYAAHSTLAEHLGIRRETLQRHLQQLIDAGYIADVTPDRAGQTHTYRLTSKGVQDTLSTYDDAVGQDEPEPPVRESNNRGEPVRETHNPCDRNAQPPVRETHNHLCAKRTQGVHLRSTSEEHNEGVVGEEASVAAALFACLDKAELHVNAAMADQWRDVLTEYEGFLTVDVVHRAFASAHGAGVAAPAPNYMRRIFDRWRDAGGPQDRRTRDPTPYKLDDGAIIMPTGGGDDRRR